MERTINYYIEDFTLTEKQKSREEYLVGYTDSLIDDLVNEKSARREKMITMRYFYHGIRDEREYAYLTENFGIGNPGSIKFIPIVRNRIEALIGLMALASFDYQVSVLDEASLKYMADERIMNSLSALYSRIQSFAEKVGKGPHPYNEEQLQQLIDQDLKGAGKDFRSVIVAACNNLIKVFKGDIDIDLFNKRKLLFEDLLVVGESIYRVRPVVYGLLPEFETMVPENFYYDIHRDQKYIKNSHRAVYVRYMSIPEVMSRYSHLMSKGDRKDIGDITLISSKQIYDPRFLEYEQRKDPDYKYDTTAKYVKVHECEWISGTFVDSENIGERQGELVEGPGGPPKQECRLDRYQSVRIGADIYLDMGRSEFVKRTERRPLHTTLTYNGLRFSDRVGEAYSLLWKCKDLQDMHDILYFHRDNTIANAGAKGSRVDVSAIPIFLGKTMTRRVMKFLAYKKQGLELYDSSLEGAEFNHFGDFDNSMSGDAINAINAVLKQLDDEVGKQTGVTPQVLGIIEQREAVNNVKQGLIQSSIVVKNLFDHNDVLTTHLISDLVTASQTSLKFGKYLGTYNTLYGPVVFEVLPEHFCMADYNIGVAHTSDEFQKLQELRGYASQQAQAGVIGPGIIPKLMKVDNLSDAIELVNEEIARAKEEGGGLQQLQQQIKELTKQLEMAEKKVSDYDAQRLRIEQQKIELERYKADKKSEIDKEKNTITRDFNEKQVALKEETVKLERDQLFIDTENKQNNEIKNI